MALQLLHAPLTQPQARSGRKGWKVALLCRPDGAIGDIVSLNMGSSYEAQSLTCFTAIEGLDQGGCTIVISIASGTVGMALEIGHMHVGSCCMEWLD